MNPIEMAFAKLKTLLRQAPERTRDGLWRRIGALLESSLQRSAPTTSEPPAIATHCENALAVGAAGLSESAQKVVRIYG
jgi:hypothetical protein